MRKPTVPALLTGVGLLASSLTGIQAASAATAPEHSASAAVSAQQQAHLVHLFHAGHLAHLAHLAVTARAAQATAVQTPVRATLAGDGDHDSDDGYSASSTVTRAYPVTRHASAYAAPARVTHYSQPASSARYTGSSGMQACIIARESGGNSQVTNSTGHYGLYQFSYSTWVASGGSPGAFGHASVAQQNQVFANAVAARGYSDWVPYDHC